MKILFLHDGGTTDAGENALAAFVRTAKNNRLETTEALVDDKTDIGTFISEKLPDLSLAAYMLSETSPEGRVWFISGYFSALKTPLLLCGRKTLSFAAGLSKYTIPLETAAAFSSFLENDTQIWQEAAGKRRAKGLLLERGIPVNEEALANMVIGGNIENISLFFEAGFSPDARDRYGVPLLCLASRSGNHEVTEILLEAGANVDFQAEDRLNTALIDSASGKYRKIMKRLIDAGADVNLKSRNGQSALSIAVGLNDGESVEMLLKAGANADEPDSLGASPRTYAGLFHNPSVLALFKTYASSENEGQAGNIKAGENHNG